MIKDLCTKCSKRDSCTQLCKKAEAYINQDYIGRRESYFSEGDISEVFKNTPIKRWPESGLSKKQIIILMYFKDNLNPVQIIEKTGISKSYVYEIIDKSLKKLGI